MQILRRHEVEGDAGIRLFCQITSANVIVNVRGAGLGARMRRFPLGRSYSSLQDELGQLVETVG